MRTIELRSLTSRRGNASGRCADSGRLPYTQRLLSVHGVVLNLFRLGRHVVRAVHHRLRRTRAFGVWREVTCV